MSICTHVVYIHTNTYILLLWLNPDIEFGLKNKCLKNLIQIVFPIGYFNDI